MRASSSDRGVQCPRSLVQLGKPIPSANGEDSREYGTAAHYYKETGELRGSEKHVALLRRKIERSGFNRDEWWKPGTGQHEVTFAIHLNSTQLLTTEMEGGAADRWKKEFSAEWLTGTIDWYVPEAPGTPAWIDDLKTGRWPVDWRTSRQLKSYALVPWIRAGRPTSWGCYVSITQWPAYPLEAPPTRTGGNISGLDLLEHLEDLRWAVAHPEEANAGVGSVGNPCAFCPNREEHPASEWMTSWKWSRLPTCWEGAAGLLRDGKLEQEGNDDE